MLNVYLTCELRFAGSVVLAEISKVSLFTFPGNLITVELTKLWLRSLRPISTVLIATKCWCMITECPKRESKIQMGKNANTIFKHT